MGNFQDQPHPNDKKIICQDCGNEFTFTNGEQEFFKTKGFDREPVRCPACRKAKKARQERDNRGYGDQRGRRDRRGQR